MNALITKTGRIVTCGAAPHKLMCRNVLGLSLDTFLATVYGGMRIMVGRNSSIAIEYHTRRPTDAQLRIIRKVLRENDYYNIMLVSKEIKSFRPIRGIGL